jgi:hypothetical protein
MEEPEFYIEGKLLEEKHLGAPVLYVPDHAKNNEDHPDCEVGFISTVSEYGIWARFHDGDTGAKCEPHNLRWL